MALSREKKLHRIAHRQFGLFTAKQAVACGYSADNHPYWYRIGQWLHLDKGIYCLPPAAWPGKKALPAELMPAAVSPDSPIGASELALTVDEIRQQNLMRWLLWSRNQDDRLEAVISHRWALACHGVLPWPGPDEALDLRVPKHFRKPAPPGLRLHRGLPPAGEIANLGPLRVTSVACAWRDCVQAGEAVRPPETSAPLTLLPVAAGEPEANLNAPASQRSLFMSPERDHTPPARRQAQAGFTLVELLVVITIISVLAALLLPVLERALSVARKAVCANNERQLGLALQGYTSDFGDYLPLVVAGPTSTNIWPYDWWRALAPFIDSSAGYDSAGLSQVQGVLHCPVHNEAFVRAAHDDSRRLRPDFGLNHTFGPNAQRVLWRRQTRFTRPTATLAVTSTGYFGNFYSSSQLDGYYLLKGVEIHNSTGVHSGGNNILWLDGHVSWWFDVRRLTLPPYSNGGAENAWSQGFDYTQP